MIPLVRPEEPETLRLARVEKLEAARAAVLGLRAIDFAGYGGDAKERLFQAQSRKCAYCEKREEQAKYRDAEHFRPKALYWWLAWTWENLLFACVDCNREHKGEQFPLADEAQRLAAEAAPPGGERPLLIDPYDPGVDPAREIEFRREIVQRRERWRPYGLTERGRETIRICGLDRPSLLTLYEAHVQDHVRLKLEPFLRIAETSGPQEIVRAWGTLLRGLFHPARQFHALSRDALRVLVRPKLRERYQLSL